MRNDDRIGTRRGIHEEGAQGSIHICDFTVTVMQTLFAVDIDELREKIPTECPKSLLELVRQCCDSIADNRPPSDYAVEWLQDIFSETFGEKVKILE